MSYWRIPYIGAYVRMCCDEVLHIYYFFHPI